MLNGRVRNGNGCDHLGMVTGKSHVAAFSRSLLANGNPLAKGERLNDNRNIKKAADSVASLYALLVISCGHSHDQSPR